MTKHQPRARAGPSNPPAPVPRPGGFYVNRSAPLSRVHPGSRGWATLTMSPARGSAHKAPTTPHSVPSQFPMTKAMLPSGKNPMPPGRGDQMSSAPHAPSRPVSCSRSSLRWGTLRDRRGQRTPAAPGHREAPGRRSGGSLDGSPDGSCSRALTSQGPRPASDVHPHSLPSSHQLPAEVLRAPGRGEGDTEAGAPPWHPSLTEALGASGSPQSGSGRRQGQACHSGSGQGVPSAAGPYPEAWEDGRLSHSFTYTCQAWHLPVTSCTPATGEQRTRLWRTLNPRPWPPRPLVPPHPSTFSSAKRLRRILSLPASRQPSALR